MKQETEVIPPQIVQIDTDVEGVNETQYIALVDGQCIGRVGVKSRGLLCATIRQLYVRPEHRGRGIGRKLVRDCIFRAGLHGCETINLSIAKCNRQVVPFYKRMGFIIAVEFSDNEIVMCLSLKGGSNE